MGINDITDNWDKNDIEIVKRLIPSQYYCLGKSDNFKFTTRYPFTCEQIVISYSELYNLFVIWNAIIHRDYFTGKSHTLDVGKHRHFIRHIPNDNNNSIRRLTKRLTGEGKNTITEAFFVVGKDALYDFCDNYLDYFLNTDNMLLENNSKNETIIREYEETRRKKRDLHFREKILKKYHSTCIICGCKEPNILEAAHIISVVNGGSDDMSNGYCLCANHHRLFDSCKLTINQGTHTFSCRNTSETDSLWHKEAEKRKFKLILPEEEQ